MRNRMILSVLPALLMLPACAGDEIQIESRQASPFVPGHAGLLYRDPDVLLFADEDDSDDKGGGKDEDDDDADCLIWDIRDHIRVDDASGTTVLTLTDDIILDASGTPRCVVEENNIGEVVVPLEDDGIQFQPLFTLHGNRLLAGDGKDGPTVYSFKDSEVMLGPVQDHDVIINASDNLAKSTPFRKLLVGVLADGACGSEGVIVPQ